MLSTTQFTDLADMEMQETGVICNVGERVDSEKRKKHLSTSPSRELEERKQHRNKRALKNPWRLLELAVVCILIVIVWGLSSLPVIFYHLPQKQVYINAPMYVALL